MIDKISESLGIEPKEITRPIKVSSQVPATLDEFSNTIIENRKKDYVSVRDNLYNLIAEVDMVVSDAVNEVRSNPSARMFETFSILVKTFADLNKDLLAISGPITETKTVEPQEKDSKSINNVVFVGTSDNLIDQIKGFTR